MLFTAVPLALLATEPQLVENLTQTLLWSAVAICIIQTVRGVLSYGSDIYSAFLMAILSVLLSPAVAGILVLFGAPVITAHEETVLCGMVLSVLVLQPLLTLYGLDPEVWRQIVSVQAPLNNVYLSSIGGAIGAWFGAVPIALDWDRPWQTYPITIVLGAYFGTFLGSIVGLAYPSAHVEQQKTKKKAPAKRIPEKKRTSKRGQAIE